MKRLWHQMKKVIVRAAFLGAMVGMTTVGVCKADDMKPVGEPNQDGSYFLYMQHLVSRADDKNSAVMVTYSNFGVMINLFVRILSAGAGVMFFFLILSAGYKLIFAGNKSEALGRVRKQLTIGIVGLIVTMAAYWITQLLLNITGIGQLMI